jgi:hypothetical protein
MKQPLSLPHSVIFKFADGIPRRMKDTPEFCFASEWCLENIGSWNYSWKRLDHNADWSMPDYVIYYFKREEDAVMFKLACQDLVMGVEV